MNNLETEYYLFIIQSFKKLSEVAKKNVDGEGIFSSQLLKRTFVTTFYNKRETPLF